MDVQEVKQNISEGINGTEFWKEEQAGQVKLFRNKYPDM